VNKVVFTYIVHRSGCYVKECYRCTDMDKIEWIIIIIIIIVTILMKTNFSLQILL